jgi:predicted acetyltransferase
MTDERSLRLRPLRPRDEAAFRAAHRAMAAADGFNFGLGLRPGMSWSGYLKALDDERAGTARPADRVPATFLVADVGGEIVGRTSIRHALNNYLRQKGGRVLVTCDDDNPGSIAVIEACGGQLDSLVEDGPDAPPIRRYWID